MVKDIKWGLGLVLAIGLLVSCEKDDSANGTKAVFSYVADGFKVNFTNFSNQATTYQWDFGDGGVSEARSPVHIFKSKGDFLVSLTVQGQTGESTFIDSVVVIGPNIRIDGDFSDWEYVSYAHENEAGGGGTLRAVKSFASSDYLFFYVEGTADFNLSVMNLYLDADNDPQTGFFMPAYGVRSGADYMFEGNYNPADPAMSAGSLYTHNNPDHAWGWDVFVAAADVMQFSQMKTANGVKALEFSVKRSQLGTTRTAVNYCLIESNAGWAQIGSLPVSNQDTSRYLPLPL